jgi:hypothetical protein
MDTTTLVIERGLLAFGWNFADFSGISAAEFGAR